MVQTTDQQREAAREFARRVFVQPNATATLSLEDIRAAVGAIDTAMDSVVGGQTIRQRLVGSFPEPFRSESTPPQKAMALVVWTLKEVGLI